jgi:hypothetical protein
MSKKNSRKIEPTEIKFLRSAKGCTILADGIGSGDTRNEPNTCSIHNKTALLRRMVKYSRQIPVTDCQSSGLYVCRRNRSKQTV